MLRDHNCTESLGCRERCWIDEDQYRCVQLDGAPPIQTDAYYRPRRVRVVRDAFDFAPRIEFFDGGVVDCSASGLNDLLTGVLQGQVRGEVSTVLGQLVGSLSHDLRDWGIPLADIPECGRTDPDTGVVFASDAMCGDALPRWFGGRRHGCVGIDDAGRFTDEPALAREYRCARVRLEIRRINLRPDGLEVVLADSTSDPQYGMLTTSPRDELRRLCDSDRPGAPPRSDEFTPGLVTRADSQLARLPNRRICHPDDPLTADSEGLLHGCLGICSDEPSGTPPSSGTQCGSLPRTDRMERCYVQPREAITPDGTDRGAGECCRPEEFCPVPPAGGGRPYFDTPPSAPVAPSTTWRCTDPVTDRWACGGCGNICASNEACCDSACTDLDTDPLHCGACERACAPGTPCAGGRCCAPGELACPAGFDGALSCTDVSSNPFACGDCDTRCSTGRCSNGVCCPPGETGCDGICADLDSDPLSCGACGFACGAGESCCGGACVSLSSDASNCGECGRRCTRGPCIGGSCRCIGLGCP